jgi:O-Antigen ligase/Virulence factor membrane-bound polymerase, C-terminal/Protein glycosylation ligase
MIDIDRKQRMSLWPWLAAALLAFPWLQPHHHPPWSGFHEDAAMAAWMTLGAFLAVASVLRRGLQWDRFALVIVGLALVVAIQSWIGLIANPGQAILFILHLLGVAACYTVARSWYVVSRHTLLDIIFTGIAIAAIGNIAIVLHQWLRLMPMDFTSTAGIWLMDIGDASRFSGNVAQPNELATLIAWGMLAGIWAHARRQVRIPVLTLYLVFLAIGAALTQSRIGLLEVACIALGLAVYRRQFGGWRLAALVAGALAVQVVLISALPNILNALLLDGEVRALNSMTQDAARLKIYSMVVEAVKLSPWWGYGATHQAQAQWALVDIVPHLNAHWMQSHNWFLDLLLWFGLPLGIGLTLALLCWAKAILRAANEPHALIALFALGCFCLHATVELIHWVANFSLVAAVFAGVLSAHSGKNTYLATGRTFNLILISFLAVGITATIVDYIRLEENFIKLRAEQIKLRTDISEPPNAWVLYHLADSLRIGRIPVTSGLDSQTLDWMERNERAAPNTRTGYNLALNLGINGEHERARKWMQQLNATSPKVWAQDFRRIWNIHKKIYPKELNGLDWPDSPP